MRGLAPALAAALLALPLAPGAAVPGEGCNPYPLGYCGPDHRVEVRFCFVVVDGRMVAATDATATPLGIPRVEGPAGPMFGATTGYLQTGPAEGFLASPGAAIPRGVLWQESNAEPGLQPVPATCGIFLWWPEAALAWMGPFLPVSVAADRVLA